NALDPNSASTHLATTLAIAVARGSDPVVCEKRTVRTLQRIDAGHCVGGADTRGDDCDLHVHLCRHLRRALWRQRFSLGLRALSLLRAAALDDVSGVSAAIGTH